MKFGKNLGRIVIPEWRRCYLDYQHLKIFVILIKRIIILISIIRQEGANEDDSHSQHKSSNYLLNNEDKRNQLKQLQEQLIKYAHQVNALFYTAHRNGIRISNRFFQMKVIQFHMGYKKCRQLNDLVVDKKHKEKVITLVQFLYVQACYLRDMKENNLEGQRKILKKHKKCSDGSIQTPLQKDRDSKRLIKQLKNSIDELENFYILLSDQQSKKSRSYLRAIANKVQIKHSQSFLFGAWIGICLTVIIVLIIILTLTGRNIETDPVFNRDFPTWRGIAFFIFYIWVLGINTYIYEEFNVSHRIIFHHNEHHYSTSTEIFVLAGTFSTFFLVMFSIYTLTITGIFSTRSLDSHWLVIFVWGALILFFIFPFPVFMYKSRLYTFKLVLMAISAPFRGVSFEAVWITNQITSLVTPFKDFAYTICYYTQLDFSIQIEVSSNYCSAATRVQIVLVVGAIAYSFRILQCLRQGYDKGAYFFTPEFFNTLKYISSLITLVLSYEYKAEYPQIITVWLVFAGISTLYSYIWDIKMDWQLLNIDAPHRFLRKILTYQPYQVYYLVMFLNLIFRLAWIATLSPSIATGVFGSPQIFSLVTGLIEIIRRGIWNLLRVQRQHLANCTNFKAMPETPNNIQSELMKQLNIKNEAQQQQSTVTQLVNTYLSNIQKITKQRKMLSGHFMELVQEQLNCEEVSRIKRQSKCKKLGKQVKLIEMKLQFLVGLEVMQKKLNKEDDEQ